MNAEQIKVLDNISKELSVLKGQFTADSEEGEDNMKPEEIKKAVTDAVTAAVAPIQKELDELKKTSTEAAPATEEVAKAEGEDMAAVIKAAVAEALAPVQKDLDAVKKAKGISKQLETDDDVEEVSGPVTKSVFAGMFGSKQ
jgi:predicted Holliday junction resolvase-like endonuclease